MRCLCATEISHRESLSMWLLVSLAQKKKLHLSVLSHCLLTWNETNLSLLLAHKKGEDFIFFFNFIERPKLKLLSSRTFICSSALQWCLCSRWAVYFISSVVGRHFPLQNAWLLFQFCLYFLLFNGEWEGEQYKEIVLSITGGLSCTA